MLAGFAACCASSARFGRLAVPGWGANTMRAEFAVLTGIPEPKRNELPTGLIENGQTLDVTLSTGIPIGKAVKSVQFFTELLPDAQVAGDNESRPQR